MSDNTLALQRELPAGILTVYVVVNMLPSCHGERVGVVSGDHHEGIVQRGCVHGCGHCVMETHSLRVGAVGVVVMVSHVNQTPCRQGAYIGDATLTRMK